jgi:histone deacetylase 1/2
MLKCTPVSTPMASSERLCSVDGDPLSAEEVTQYPNIVGGLQYLTVTRPDLSFVVNKVCQYLHKPVRLIGQPSSAFFAMCLIRLQRTYNL